MDLRRIFREGYEEVWEASDPSCQFQSFIAIHNTKRGPSLGGVRFWNYPSKEAALEDVLRLARFMTYKAAVADLPLGGGKGVILQPKGQYDRTLLMERFAQFVNRLEGRYITAKDVGTGMSEMSIFKEHTDWVVGLPPEKGGAGDPSPLTAYGVLIGIHVTVEEILKKNSLKGVKVAIQGLGGVGSELARILTEERAEVWGTDIVSQKIFSLSKDLGVHPILPEMILESETEVFAPCALGQVINQNSIPQLKCKIIAGAANNQLEVEKRDAALLNDRGIFFAPDFVVNAGGLIHVAWELRGYDFEKARKTVEKIRPTLLEIFNIAKEEKITTLEAATRLAEERL